MTTTLVMAALLFASTAFQVLAPAWGGLGGAKPPLLLACVLYYALNRGRRQVLFAAAAAGLLYDLHAACPLGVHMLVFGALGLLAFRFQRVVLTDSAVTPAVFGLAAAVAAELVTYAVLRRAGLPAWPLGRLAYRLGVTGLLGAVVSPLVFAAARCADRVMGNIEVREIVDGIEQPLRR